LRYQPELGGDGEIVCFPQVQTLHVFGVEHRPLFLVHAGDGGLVFGVQVEGYLSAGERARNLRQKSREEKVNARFIIPGDRVLDGVWFGSRSGENRATSQH
jgi:hypothetical protein